MIGKYKKLALILLCSLRGISSTSGMQPLNEHDLRTIYQQFVAVNFTGEYKYRYHPLPLHKNNKAWRWEDKDFSRVIALLEFERFIEQNTISAEKALIINGTNDPELQYIHCKQKICISYSSDPEKYDLQTLDLVENDFDFVMLNQTLEHVYDPILCLKNVRKYMKKGGILYLNAPSINIPHDTPMHHYSGFTPTGLGAIVQAAGFKILSIGQWGNKSYILKLFSELGWPDYLALGRNDRNFSVNDFYYPAITWIFAKNEECEMITCPPIIETHIQIT